MTACEVCARSGPAAKRCEFGHPSGPCSCWRGEPCLPPVCDYCGLRGILARRADGVTLCANCTARDRALMNATIALSLPASPKGGRS